MTSTRITWLLPLLMVLSGACGNSTTATSSTTAAGLSLVQGETTIASGTTDVATGLSFNLIFPVATILTSTVTTTSVTLACSGTALTFTLTPATAGTTSQVYEIIPASALPASASCTLTVTAGATTSAGVSYAGSFTFTTTASTAPTVTLTGTSGVTGSSTSISTAGTSNISGGTSTPVTATFSKEMAIGTINRSNVSLSCGGTAQTIFLNITTANTVFTITPLSNISSGSTCIVTFGTGIEDSAGNALAAATTFTYTTFAPTVSLTGTLLSSGASTTIATDGTTTGISGATTAPLTATFSTGMAASLVSAGTTLQCPSGTTIASTVAATSSTVYTLTPSVALTPLTSCVVSFANSILDLNGNSLAATNITDQTGCSTSDNFNTSATVSTSSSSCWTENNASSAATAFGISSGAMVITYAANANPSFGSIPSISKSLPGSTTSFTVIAQISAASGIEGSSGADCMLTAQSGTFRSLQGVKIGVTNNSGSLAVESLDITGSPISTLTNVSVGIYVKMVFANSTITTSYSTDSGSTYTPTSGTSSYSFSGTSDPITLALSGQARGDATPVSCSFDNFTVTGATATSPNTQY